MNYNICTDNQRSARLVITTDVGRRYIFESRLAHDANGRYIVSNTPPETEEEPPPPTPSPGGESKP